jgi:hypothetical protein
MNFILITGGFNKAFCRACRETLAVFGASGILGDQAVKQYLRTVGGITGASRKSATGLREAYGGLHEAYSRRSGAQLLLIIAKMSKHLWIAGFAPCNFTGFRRSQPTNLAWYASLLSM